MRGHPDLRRVVVLSLLCAAVALLVPVLAVRWLAAVPLCLVLPGYAVTCAAFGPRRLDRERLAVLTVGMSLATLVLCALVLNYLPGGIRDVSWASILVLIAIGASRWAAIRREAPRRRTRTGRPIRLGRADAVLLGGGLLAALAALVVSATVFSADSATGYTRLSMLSEASGAAVTVGIESNEQRRHSYHLRVGVSGRKLIASEVSLEPGEERELRVPLGDLEGGRPQKVTASLYRRSAPKALLRRVTSWVAAEEAPR